MPDVTQPTSDALSDDPFPDSAVFEKVEEDHGATPTYMIVVRESWRESILCEGMYGWAADWLVKQLNDLEGVRKDRLVGLSQAVTSRTFAAMQESLDQALARCEAAETLLTQTSNALLGAEARCEAAEKRVEELTGQKDGAYNERDRLVSALSFMFPGSHLARHEGDWEDDWRNIVCLHLPTGQATWHVHDSEMDLFSHLPLAEDHWDGHSTEEKYLRLERFNRIHSLHEMEPNDE